MQPVIFDDCVGWLHPAPGSYGVVLCNPFGNDEMYSHRAWLLLAEELAAKSMPVLRFDYPGTGNSLGVEDDPARIDAWIDSIAAAVSYLRAVTGVRQVAICGLRLGATLAALAAQRLGDVDGLVLLAPVLTGKKYLRELHAHWQQWLNARKWLGMTTPAAGPRIAEAFGFGLHGADVERLAGVDLRVDTTAPARRVLLLEANDHRNMDTLVARYQEHGVTVEREGFDEMDHFLVDRLYSKLPVHAFATVSAWLAADIDADGSTRSLSAEGVHDRENASPCATATQGVPVALELAGGDFVEQPVSIGTCFGVYCRPRVARANAPAVLFPNTGGHRNIGEGRFYVLFARRLAALGIASLRMDLSGLGESAPLDLVVTQDVLHSEQSKADTMAGADWLVAHGHAAVVTLGVCSGAFISLQACAAHPRIVGGFGVNLQKFAWDGHVSVSDADRSFVVRAAKWRQVLNGQVSVTRFARKLARRAARRVLRGCDDLLDTVSGRSFWPGGTSLLRRIQKKGAEVRLLYGEMDSGVDELKVQFGNRLSGLRRFAHVRVAIVPKLDHALYTRSAREIAMSDAQQWLLDRFCTAHDSEASPAQCAGLAPASVLDARSYLDPTPP